MKKFISALLTLALLFGLAVPTTASAAEETVTVYANDTDKVIAENVKDGYMENQGLYEETTGYYGLKPADDTLGDAKIYFSVDVETAGQYEIVVAYAAKTGDSARKCDVYVDETLSQALNLTCNADWETKSEAKFRIDLTAGEHDIVITTPSDYDNSSVKTPNIYAVKYTLKKAAEPVVETVTVYANDTDKVIAENVKDGYMENQGLYEETTGYYGLKPADDTLGDAKIYFSVDVETAGLYEIVVAYAAKTGDSARKCDVYIDDTLSQALNLTCNADWETKSEAKFRVNLTAGEHDIVITTPSDYDNSSVKTPNIYAVKYTLKQAAETPKVPTTPEEIVNALYALEDDQSLEGEYTLTGVIKEFKYTYSPSYSTIQLTIVVGDMTDKPVVCYKLGGEGIDKVEVGDTITVTGPLKNYKDTYEFNGCTLVSYEKAVVAPQKGILGRVNSYDWGANGHANAVFSFVSSDETATASTILGQPVGTFAWWYAFVLEYNEDNGTFVVTVADTVMDGVNAIETATLGYGKLAFMFHDGFKDTDADTFNYFLEKATVGTEFYLVGDYDVMGATWDVIADTYLTTEKPEKFWTKPVVTPDEPVIEGDEYVVQKGDTLSKIAKACGLTVNDLVEANKIENPNLIRKGTTLIIPKVEVKRHIVVKGDTLSQIAKANGCTVEDLMNLNKIENPDLIHRGDIIVLP